MKLSSLLARRRALREQARLANLAFAYARLCDIHGRVTRARLSGEVRLQQAAPEEERYADALIALEGNQSVLEEHFTEEDISDLVTLLGHVTGRPEIDLILRLEAMADEFLGPLRTTLARAGVAIDVGGDWSSGVPQQEAPSDRSAGGEGD